MESFGDKLRAYALAALVHLLVAALLLAGLFWTASTAKPTIAGPVIEAELVGLTAAPRPRATTRPQPPKPPEPKPEQPKPEPPKTEPKPEPPTPPAPTRNDQIERQKVAEMAREKAEQEKRAQEEKVRQEQILLEQQQERETQRKLAEVRREREAADRKLKLEQQKMQQLKDLQAKKPAPVTPAVPEATEAKTGAAGTDTSLAAEYFAAIQNAVTQNWLRPDNAQAGLRCMLRIVQIPGGDVIGVQISSPCNADPQTRASIEQAVKRAAPLPYKGYEKVFQRDINFNFSYDG